MIAQPTSTGWFSPDRRPLTALLSTSFVSMVSNQLTGLAVPWFVLELTGSVSKMGLTAAFTMLPSVVMMFLGGAIADRMSPRRLSVFSDVISGMTVAMVPLLYVLDALTFPLLLALMVAGAIFDTPGYSARSKLVPQLAKRGSIAIEKVTSLQGAMQAISLIFGAVLAGMLIGLLGATTVLWINAAAFALSALTMLLVIPEFHVPREAATSIMQDIREGLHYVVGDPFLRTIVIAALLINALTVPIPAVLLPYTANTVWESAFWFGMVMSGFGVGALVGSILSAALADRVSRRILFSVALLMFSIPVFVMVTVPGPVITWASMFWYGFGSGLINPMLQAILYRITAETVLGRVMGVISAGAMIASPAGVLLATPLVNRFGLGTSYLVFATLSLLVALALIFNPVMTRLESIDAAKDTEDPLSESTIGKA